MMPTASEMLGGPRTRTGASVDATSALMVLAKAFGLSPEQQAAVLSAATVAGKTSTLSDGTTGWHMSRSDDCWECAVATCLQLPLSSVPDARLDERVRAGEDPAAVDRRAWIEFDEWLDHEGMRMTQHSSPPWHLDRWIGIVPRPQAFMSHSLVMAGREVLFDPAVAPGTRTFYPIEAKYGYSFQRED